MYPCYNKGNQLEYNKLNTRNVNWKKYELEILDGFKQKYPNAIIKHNQEIQGRFSRTLRQIDILIESRIAGRLFRIIIDGKYYNNNIDVKDVESFISMAEDVDAHHAILITSKGYSRAAINRAFYGSSQVELDILNFEELMDLQGVGGIIFSGKHGVILSAPFGWIIDAKKRNGSLAWLYRRGLDYTAVEKEKEGIYVNICSYNNSIENISTLLELHERDTLIAHPKAKIEYIDSTIEIPDSSVILRKITREEIDIEEYTILIDFNDFCVFFVLFTTKELVLRTLPKLEFCAERVLRLDVNQTSILKEHIDKVEKSILETQSKTEKAELFIAKATIYLDFQEYDKAIEAYNDSIEQLPLNYGARHGLLELGFSTDNRDVLLEEFYQLSEGNRQICSDILQIGLNQNSPKVVEGYFKKKIRELQKGKHEERGNLLFTLGELYHLTNKEKKALQMIQQAKDSFEKCFNIEHESITTCIEILGDND